MMIGRQRGGKHPFETIITGLAMSVAFSVYWVFNPHVWWPIFGIVFAGALPMLRGIRALIIERADRPQSPRLSESERSSENERVVLRIAQSQAGRLTPSMVVLNSTLSLEEAETILDSFAKKGHADLRVLGDGRINYEFKEFLPPQ